MNRLETAILSFLLIVTPTLLRGQEIVIQDSATFIKSSLVVITPGPSSYSSLGHCALRMECPSEGLDYCFSLEMEGGAKEHIQFFMGNAIAGVFGIPTRQFIVPYQQEGRGIRQYELNLTLKEKQQLWKSLDEEIVKPPHLKFNFLNTNCVMMCMQMIEGALTDESLHFPHLPSYMLEDNGERIRYITRDRPWQQFIYILLAGSACDLAYDIEYTLSPETIVEVLQDAEIHGSGPSRSLLAGEVATLLKETNKEASSSIPPALLFASILLLVVIASLIDFHTRRHSISSVIDVILLTAQTLIGIFLLYTSMAANLFGTRWNWYLIPFAPLPLLIWLVGHKKGSFYQIYLIYAIVLAVFICCTPLSSQLDWTHQLAIAPLLVRSTMLFIEGKKDAKK